MPWTETAAWAEWGEGARRLPKRTRECLAACAAVGLHYWGDHPRARHVWAVDDSQRAHVVRINRDGTAQHVCSPELLIEQCALLDAIEEVPGDQASSSF